MLFFLRKKRFLSMVLFLIILIGGLYYWNQASFVIFPLQWVSLLFFEKGKTAEELIASGKCRIAANGNYFGIDEEKKFFPAGNWFTEDVNLQVETTDPNLQNTIRFFQNSWKADLFFEQTEAERLSGSVVFNAWPRLLQSGKVNNQLDQQISHRKQEVPRTVLVKDGNDQTFLFLSKKGITLADLAKELQTLGFQAAINLDGGPSTSFAKTGLFAQKFQADEVLPLFFCRG